MVAILIVGIVTFAIGVYVGLNMPKWFNKSKKFKNVFIYYG